MTTTRKRDAPGIGTATGPEDAEPDGNGPGTGGPKAAGPGGPAATGRGAGGPRDGGPAGTGQGGTGPEAAEQEGEGAGPGVAAAGTDGPTARRPEAAMTGAVGEAAEVAGTGAAGAGAAPGVEPDAVDGEGDGEGDGGGDGEGDGGGAERRGDGGSEGADAPTLSRVRAWWRLVRRQPMRRVAVCAVLAVLLLAAGGLRWQQARLADPAAARNQALTDTATTDQVIGDVSNALGRIFAYTPSDTQTTADAARDVLAGTAAAQYQALFARITQQVAAQHLTLTTRVVRAGVVTLADGHARLLVFLDQTAQRAGATATTAAAQLSVTAQLRDGRWRITSLTAR